MLTYKTVVSNNTITQIPIMKNNFCYCKCILLFFKYIYCSTYVLCFFIIYADCILDKLNLLSIYNSNSN